MNKLQQVKVNVIVKGIWCVTNEDVEFLDLTKPYTIAVFLEFSSSVSLQEKMRDSLWKKGKIFWLPLLS